MNEDRIGLIALFTMGILISIILAIMHNKQNQSEYDEESRDDFYS